MLTPQDAIAMTPGRTDTYASRRADTFTPTPVARAQGSARTGRGSVSTRGRPVCRPLRDELPCLLRANALVGPYEADEEPLPLCVG